MLLICIIIAKAVYATQAMSITLGQSFTLPSDIEEIYEKGYERGDEDFEQDIVGTISNHDGAPGDGFMFIDRSNCCASLVFRRLGAQRAWCATYVSEEDELVNGEERLRPLNKVAVWFQQPRDTDTDSLLGMMVSEYNTHHFIVEFGDCTARTVKNGEHGQWSVEE